MMLLNHSTDPQELDSPDDLLATRRERIRSVLTVAAFTFLLAAALLIASAVLPPYGGAQ